MMPETQRSSGALAVLRAVHDRPGIERAVMAGELGMTSGFAAETVARLGELELISEGPASRTGGRGRPTTTLHPHRRGPLVVAAGISHETWRMAVTELGGRELNRVEQRHDRDPTEVLSEVGAALAAVRRQFGLRIRAVAISVPGTVTGAHLAQAPKLDWHNVDLAQLWPRERHGRSFIAGNDATFSALAEARRGAASGAGSSLHLFMQTGMGGALIDNGRLLLGATGTAGEFGHMPFGDPEQRCRCGASGCWNTSIDGFALARALVQPEPVDEISYSRAVIALAEAPPGADGAPPPELNALRRVGAAVGRGVAGLVNALDPDIVTLGGLGQSLLRVAGDHVYSAYLAGLMQFRAAAPTPLVPGQLAEDAPLIGATEEAFSRVLTDHGLQIWASSR